jgi:hypothetical protein
MPPLDEFPATRLVQLERVPLFERHQVMRKFGQSRHRAPPDPSREQVTPARGSVRVEARLANRGQSTAQAGTRYTTVDDDAADDIGGVSV